MADKTRMQTLREQGLGAKTIVKAYSEKQWKLSSVQTLDETGSEVDQCAGSGRQRNARMTETINDVSELIRSHWGQSSTYFSTRQIAAELDISQSSVICITKNDLYLRSFHRVPTQIIRATHIP